LSFTKKGCKWLASLLAVKTILPEKKPFCRDGFHLILKNLPYEKEILIKKRKD
jgi:hypothetical protein